MFQNGFDWTVQSTFSQLSRDSVEDSRVAGDDQKRLLEQARAHHMTCPCLTIGTVWRVLSAEFCSGEHKFREETQWRWWLLQYLLSATERWSLTDTQRYSADQGRSDTSLFTLTSALPGWNHWPKKYSDVGENKNCRMVSTSVKMCGFNFDDLNNNFNDRHSGAIWKQLIG